ncbi:hypothetical protein HYW94_00475 [Candidatus Uhrbacteria bacterium]|nr:hypothetical protein [Candidatus Uhrbacteria bacterium]
MDIKIIFPLFSQGGFAAFNSGLEAARDGAGVANKGIEAFIGVLVQAVLGLVGVIFLILIIYGGFKWMSAAGQGKQLEEAQKMITHSIVGLIIVVLAYAISTFLLKALQGAV